MIKLLVQTEYRGGGASLLSFLTRFLPHKRFLVKKPAFTLAEVLITLGIIGVVAAMTLPALQQKIDERANIAMLQKFYSEFASATNLLVSEYGEPSSWNLVDNDAESSTEIVNMYKQRFSIQKFCMDGDTSCFAFPIKTYSGVVHITEAEYSSWALKSFILTNGVTVFLDINNAWFAVFFDVNGMKKPNQLGIDVFGWAVDGRGRIVRNEDDTYNHAFEIMENSWTKKY